MQPAHVMDFTQGASVLAVSLELSSKNWKLALDDGRRSRPRIWEKVSDDKPLQRLEQVIGVIEGTKRKWELPAEMPVTVVYEAGQDGFWIQRALESRGYPTVVVDPASLEVSRQARRAKTDRLDAEMLVRALLAWLRGDRKSMRVVRIPSVQEEGLRQGVRERGLLQKEIAQHRDRMRKLLRPVGVWEEVSEQRLQAGAVTDVEGHPLPAALQQRLANEAERVRMASEQLAKLEKTLCEQLPQQTRERVEQLKRLKGIGWVAAVRLVLELFWRKFGNRREVGSCVGLVPQPYNSGDMVSDQGISKSGNRRVRALLIELAWLWLRYQPQSELAVWFNSRTAGDSKRGRRVAIVAVARRLVILLWRFLETGALPPGVQLKAA